MILPSKHISQDQSFLGVGAVLIKELKRPQTVTNLWEKVRCNKSVGNFERFVLALDMLYITGVVTLSNGMVVKEQS